jgi:hypothetical protein
MKQLLLKTLAILLLVTACELNGAKQDQTLVQENFLNISNTVLASPDTIGKYRMITFDIKWENSWRTRGSPHNWDAAWVFIKYKVGNGEWRHARFYKSR